MNPPEMTDEQRAEGLRRAAEARRERAQIRADLRLKQISFAQAVEYEPAQRIRVFDLIRAVPGYGHARATDLMERLGISPIKRVGGLTERQKADLLAHFEEGAGRE